MSYVLILVWLSVESPNALHNHGSLGRVFSRHLFVLQVNTIKDGERTEVFCFGILVHFLGGDAHDCTIDFPRIEGWYEVPFSFVEVGTPSLRIPNTVMMLEESEFSGLKSNEGASILLAVVMLTVTAD